MYCTEIRFDEVGKKEIMNFLNFNNFNNYMYHLFSYSFFNKDEEHKHSFRVEESDNETIMFINSDKKPKDIKIDNVIIETVETDENEIEEGNTCCVRVHLARYKQKNGKEIFVKKEEVEKWMEELFERKGMKIIECDGICENKKQVFRKNNHNSIVSYLDGEFFVKINNKEEFKNSLIKGVGRCTSDGFGMIQILND